MSQTECQFYASGSDSLGQHQFRVSVSAGKNRRGFVLALLLSGLLFPNRLLGADVSYYSVIKSARYEQAVGSAPLPLATNAYGFTALVVPMTNHVVTNATVKPSNSTPLRTLQPDTNGMSLLFTEEFATQTQLDSVYPTGSTLSPASYSVTMYTRNDGVQSGSLSFILLFFPLSYPATPEIANLASAQDIDQTRDVQLAWAPLGGNLLTIVQLSVMDAASNIVYATPAPFQPGALTSSSVSNVIPAYALPPGTSLFGHLTVANPGNPNTNSYPGATGLAALAKDTQFQLTTRPSPTNPVLEVISAGASPLQLRVRGEPNRLYHVQSSSDLLNWTNLFTTNSSSGVFDYSDSGSFAAARKFYRGKVGQ
jgi:hypothetical protein